MISGVLNCTYMKKNLAYIITSFLPAILLFAWNETPLMQGLYLQFPNIDVPMHIVGGACIVFLAARIFSLLEGAGFKKLHPLTRFALLVGSAACIGVAWEWYEFIHDFVYHTHFQLSQFDTMKDLFDDLFGASLLALFYTL